MAYSLGGLPDSDVFSEMVDEAMFRLKKDASDDRLPIEIEKLGFKTMHYDETEMVVAMKQPSRSAMLNLFKAVENSKTFKNSSSLFPMKTDASLHFDNDEMTNNSISIKGIRCKSLISDFNPVHSSKVKHDEKKYHPKDIDNILVDSETKDTEEKDSLEKHQQYVNTHLPRNIDTSIEPGMRKHYYDSPSPYNEKDEKDAVVSSADKKERNILNEECREISAQKQVLDMKKIQKDSEIVSDRETSAVFNDSDASHTFKGDVRYFEDSKITLLTTEKQDDNSSKMTNEQDLTFNFAASSVNLKGPDNDPGSYLTLDPTRNEDRTTLLKNHTEADSNSSERQLEPTFPRSTRDTTRDRHEERNALRNHTETDNNSKMINERDPNFSASNERQLVPTFPRSTRDTTRDRHEDRNALRNHTETDNNSKMINEGNPTFSGSSEGKLVPTFPRSTRDTTRDRHEDRNALRIHTETDTNSKMINEGNPTFSGSSERKLVPRSTRDTTRDRHEDRNALRNHIETDNNSKRINERDPNFSGSNERQLVPRSTRDTTRDRHEERNALRNHTETDNNSEMINERDPNFSASNERQLVPTFPRSTRDTTRDRHEDRNALRNHTETDNNSKMINEGNPTFSGSSERQLVPRSTRDTTRDRHEERIALRNHTETDNNSKMINERDPNFSASNERQLEPTFPRSTRDTSRDRQEERNALRNHTETDNNSKRINEGNPTFSGSSERQLVPRSTRDTSRDRHEERNALRNHTETDNNSKMINERDPNFSASNERQLVPTITRSEVNESEADVSFEAIDLPEPLFQKVYKKFENLIGSYSIGISETKETLISVNIKKTHGYSQLIEFINRKYPGSEFPDEREFSEIRSQRSSKMNAESVSQERKNLKNIESNPNTTKIDYTDVVEMQLDAVKLGIKMADITLVSTDVIVYPANRRLDAHFGLSKAVSESAGRQLTSVCENFIKLHSTMEISDVLISPAGNLKAKEVFHAVGPSLWDSAFNKDLRKTILSCLALADLRGHTSIFLAPISTSTATPELIESCCFKNYLLAVKSFEKYFIQRGKRPNLGNVTFVDRNEKMVNELATYLQLNFRKPTSTSHDDIYDQDVLKSIYEEAKSDSSSFMLPLEGRSFAGSLSKQQRKRKPMSSSGQNSSLECSVCIRNKGVKTLSCCYKRICQDCSERIIKCPHCQKTLRIPRGSMPDGTMTITEMNFSLAGFEHFWTYEIKYEFQEGVQSHEHPNPGQRYHAARRPAFLPITTHGTRLLHRLVLAFLRRLTFAIGTSKTTGKENRIVWNGIQHKTTCKQGHESFSYPDPGYLKLLDDLLNDRGVTLDSMNKDEESQIIKYKKDLNSKKIASVVLGGYYYPIPQAWNK